MKQKNIYTNELRYNGQTIQASNWYAYNTF